MVVPTPEKLEFRHFIPMTFCLDESKGVDAGSREEMVAFLTTELADLQYVLAEEAAGED